MFTLPCFTVLRLPPLSFNELLISELLESRLVAAKEAEAFILINAKINLISKVQFSSPAHEHGPSVTTRACVLRNSVDANKGIIPVTICLGSNLSAHVS